MKLSELCFQKKKVDLSFKKYSIAFKFNFDKTNYFTKDNNNKNNYNTYKKNI